MEVDAAQVLRRARWGSEIDESEVDSMREPWRSLVSELLRHPPQARGNALGVWLDARPWVDAAAVCEAVAASRNSPVRGHEKADSRHISDAATEDFRLKNVSIWRHITFVTRDRGGETGSLREYANLLWRVHDRSPGVLAKIELIGPDCQHVNLWWRERPTKREKALFDKAYSHTECGREYGGVVFHHEPTAPQASLASFFRHDAWIARRLVSGLHEPSDLGAASLAFRPIAERLAAIPLGERSIAFWQWLDSQGEVFANGFEAAMRAADPEGHLPT